MTIYRNMTSSLCRDKRGSGEGVDCSEFNVIGSN